MDSLKGMAIFATVVDKGSMAAAAQSLGMTPSAVSQQIRKLESRAQVTLLHRTTRRLTLTEAGEAFYRSCAQMLAIAEEAERRLGEWRDAPVGELRLAAPVGFSGTLITQALKPLLENHRQLRLQLFFQDERIDLVAERIDLAIRVAISPTPAWWRATSATGAACSARRRPICASGRPSTVRSS